MSRQQLPGFAHSLAVFHPPTHRSNDASARLPVFPPRSTKGETADNPPPAPLPTQRAPSLGPRSPGAAKAGSGAGQHAGNGLRSPSQRSLGSRGQQQQQGGEQQGAEGPLHDGHRQLLTKLIHGALTARTGTTPTGLGPGAGAGSDILRSPFAAAGGEQAAGAAGGQGAKQWQQRQGPQRQASQQWSERAPSGGAAGMRPSPQQGPSGMGGAPQPSPRARQGPYARASFGAMSMWGPGAGGAGGDMQQASGGGAVRASRLRSTPFDTAAAAAGPFGGGGRGGPAGAGQYQPTRFSFDGSYGAGGGSETVLEVSLNPQFSNEALAMFLEALESC